METEEGDYMSLSRIAIFVIGLVLALVGLFLVVNNLHDLFSLVVGAVLIVIGVVLLSGKVLTI